MIVSKNMVHDIAIRAKDFARGIINDEDSSSTSIKMNNHSPQKQEAIARDVCLMRGGATRHEGLEYGSVHWHQSISDPKHGFGKERPEEIAPSNPQPPRKKSRYRSSLRQACDDFLDESGVVQASKKGNCGEYAMLALKYVVAHNNSNSAQINAECYEVQGGDHVFLVVGREPASNPKDPSTWGESAYICDPWANDVYEAKDYLTKTKGFSTSAVSPPAQFPIINKTIDFDPQEHSLAPQQANPNYNTTYLNQALNSDLTINKQHYLESITNLYARKSAALTEIVERNITDLQQASSVLSAEKKAIFDKKITDLQTLKSMINRNFDEMDRNIKACNPKDQELMDSNPVYKNRRVLENHLEQSIVKLKETMKVTPEEEETLNKVNFLNQKGISFIQKISEGLDCLNNGITKKITNSQITTKLKLKDVENMTDSTPVKRDKEEAFKNKVESVLSEEHTSALTEKLSDEKTDKLNPKHVSERETSSAEAKPDVLCFSDREKEPETLQIKEDKESQKDVELEHAPQLSAPTSSLAPPNTSNNVVSLESFLDKVDMSSLNQISHQAEKPAATDKKVQSRMAQLC